MNKMMFCMLVVFCFIYNVSADSTNINKNIREGKKYYRVCIPCHGVMGEKNVDGDSSVIANWNKRMILGALEGYENRTYGGKNKNVMYLFVSKLDRQKMEYIADYIVSINKNLPNQ